MTKFDKQNKLTTTAGNNTSRKTLLEIIPVLRESPSERSLFPVIVYFKRAPSVVVEHGILLFIVCSMRSVPRLQISSLRNEGHREEIISRT